MNDPARAELALFGTSADPPTLGHRALLTGLAAHYPRVRTWASDNPFKQHGAPLEVRSALLQAVVDGLANPRLRLAQELSSPRALDTLERARAHWPEAPLVFVVGSDLLPQIHRWFAVETILGLCRLAVVPRLGWPIASTDLDALRQRGAQVDLVPLRIPATASSEIRLHPDPELVPVELWPMLQERHLYGFEPVESSLVQPPPHRRPLR
ncbi:nicotinate-nucleotide adenylyltransferase [Synechococcus sp. Tobar12-5m-g]|jgi:nicotinate-nucleotide adenylyltransferase|uniref:nicotinate-nucleotide adenylyltransferase n=1 Tax=unclassified Synechococcus TaxID=2626047 RepID=UPI0020CCA789|nr:MULTISPECIES: nicotinate-nucleotide adenylyltransferase [unclassified Synechococcus]MCP9771312.1 nicotinate-nucleotide adenylyltransferase [Synechococcus sp. Tobar12-5m-g]MCP9872252.1 nicotinate-nucleotide adenylyltransferase [Synechococcus sp. Cruz CV-v-12]